MTTNHQLPSSPFPYAIKELPSFTSKSYHGHLTEQINNDPVIVAILSRRYHPSGCKTYIGPFEISFLSDRAQSRFNQWCADNCDTLFLNDVLEALQNT